MNAETSVPYSAPGLMKASRETLSPSAKCLVLAAVVFFHVGGGWALTQVEPAKLIVGDIAPMEVRMVAAEQVPEPEIENAEPPPSVDLKPRSPDLAAIVDPPPPDLPPPEFPIAKLDIPPPDEPPSPVIPPLARKPEHRPKSPELRARERPPAPPPAPVDAQPEQAPPRVPAAPRTVSASQLGYLVAPSPVYPARSRKVGEQGTVVVRVLVDVAGRPAQVSLQTSSGYPELDQSAVSAVRAAQFRPYAEGGLPQAVWVQVPINFLLR